MTEGMAGKTVFPAEFFFVGADEIRDTLMVNRFGRIPFLRKKPVTGTVLFRDRIPVLQDEFPGVFRKLCIAVGTVFRSPDMDAASGMFDIGTFQVSDFANTEPCGEHQAEKGFKFKVRNRSKKRLHFFPCRDKRDIRIKLAEGKLVRIPRFTG